MPKFFNEVWLHDMAPKTVSRAIEFFKGQQINDPTANMTILAGPWLSNEEAKVYFVTEVDDPTETFTPFAERVADGLFLKRRLTLIQGWDEARSLSRYLSSR